MLTGHVLGRATSTVKHPSMHGWKLLVVQPLLSGGNTPDGDPVLVVDSLGAGKGETVMITSDGLATRELIGHDNTPVRWSVMGIID